VLDAVDAGLDDPDEVIDVPSDILWDLEEAPALGLLVERMDGWSDEQVLAFVGLRAEQFLRVLQILESSQRLAAPAERAARLRALLQRAARESPWDVDATVL
jgi:hypothetical protein